MKSISLFFGLRDFRGNASRRGQVMIYMVTALMLLTLTGFWLADYTNAATKRIRAQNAADSAALAAAQWQARSLNAVGEINLVKAINTLLDNVPPGTQMQAAITGATPDAAYAAIQSGLDNLQARIAFAGPILAMVGAQQAAKNNGIASNTTYSNLLRERADVVTTTYAANFSTPYWGSGDWAADYAKMLNYLADEGVAAAADNAKFFDKNFSASPQAHQWLLTRAFYDAIAIQNWCYLRPLLFGVYNDYTYWGDITALPQSFSAQSEFFGLGVDLIDSDNLLGTGGLTESQVDRLHTYFTTEIEKRNLTLHTDWPQFVPQIHWCVFVSSFWGPWDASRTYSTSLSGTVKPELDYTGCDAVTAITDSNTPLLALSDRSGSWTSWLTGSGNQSEFSGSVSRIGGTAALSIHANAAAKPFGVLPNISEPAYTYRVVLPIFQDVRLIPVALASSYGASDPDWLIHRTEHLPLNGAGDTVAYVQFGPDSLPDSCYYCRLLKIWEAPAFRSAGETWLTEIDPQTGALLHECLEFGPGGGSGAGGVPYAH